MLLCYKYSVSYVFGLTLWFGDLPMFYWVQVISSLYCEVFHQYSNIFCLSLSPVRVPCLPPTPRYIQLHMNFFVYVSLWTCVYLFSVSTQGWISWVLGNTHRICSWNWLHWLTLEPTLCKGRNDPHPCQHLILSNFLIFASLMHVMWYFVSLVWFSKNPRVHNHLC